MKRVLLIVSLFMVLPTGAMQEKKKDSGSNTPTRRKRSFSFWGKKKNEAQETKKNLEPKSLSEKTAQNSERKKKPDEEASDIPLVGPIDDVKEGDIEKAVAALCLYCDQQGNVINWQSVKVNECAQAACVMQKQSEVFFQRSEEILAYSKQVSEEMKKINTLRRHVFFKYVCVASLLVNVVLTYFFASSSGL